MKTLIAVPAMDTVPTRFALSLAMLKKFDQTVIGSEIGSLIYTARNNLATKAVQMDADFVLWLDSDMVFPPDTLERLYNDYKAEKGDIISGVYFRRVAPFKPVLFDKLDITEAGTFTTEFDKIPDDIFEVQGCGFGCVLMPAEVLMDVIGKFGNPFDPLPTAGEDLSFCWRARQCGYRIVCDPSITLGHVGNMVIDRSFYESYQTHEEGL